MTPQERTVMELALEALNKLTDVFLDTEGNHGDYEQKALNQGNKAITAIKEALAQPEQPKVRTGNCLRVGVCASEGHKIQPQRTWVSLTDEQIDQGLLRTNYAFKTAEAWRDGVEWAMTQLKELNHGS